MKYINIEMYNVLIGSGKIQIQRTLQNDKTYWEQTHPSTSKEQLLPYSILSYGCYYQSNISNIYKYRSGVP